MTYDPDRDARAPADVSPNRRPYERETRAGVSPSVALMLAIMAAFIGVGFWLYATQDTTTLVGDRPAAERTTTGSATQQPLPNTPTPPTVPSQQ